MKKELTYKELIALALEYYNRGGDGVYECWDECTFNEYIKEFGAITKEVALKMFGVWESIWNEMQATVF